MSATFVHGLSTGAMGRVLIGRWTLVPNPISVAHLNDLLMTWRAGNAQKLIYICVTAFSGMPDMGTQKIIRKTQLPILLEICEHAYVPWETTGLIAGFQRTVMQGFVALAGKGGLTTFSRTTHDALQGAAARAALPPAQLVALYEEMRSGQPNVDAA